MFFKYLINYVSTDILYWFSTFFAPDFKCRRMVFMYAGEGAVRMNKESSQQHMKTVLFTRWFQFGFVLYPASSFCPTSRTQQESHQGWPQSCASVCLTILKISISKVLRTFLGDHDSSQGQGQYGNLLFGKDGVFLGLAGLLLEVSLGLRPREIPPNSPASPWKTPSFPPFQSIGPLGRCFL